MLVHELLNRLSVIVGNCELAIESAQEGLEGSANRQGVVARLIAIRDSAQSVAFELKNRNCVSIPPKSHFPTPNLQSRRPG